MLCLRWLATGLILSSHDVKSSMEVDCNFFWIYFDGIYMCEFIEHLSYPSKASQMSSVDWTLVFPN